MKLHTEQDVVLGNSGKTKAFTISASANAFLILSSGIYKHKIRAIVRELVCNAVDAHMLNGNKKPWIVKAPNDLDPTFVVTDFGPGLNDEDMFEVYTQYFNSTKTNDEIGGFGLGAKSPFSYTNTFTVESRHKGLVRTYNAMIVSGEPQLLKVYEGAMEPTDEPGITVTVPCNPSDIQAWHREIKYIMRPFDKNTYTLLGVTFTIDSFQDIEGYNDDVFVGNATTDAAGLYAVFGNIVYPINTADVEGVDAEWLKLAGRCVFIHFPMNTLSPQPSREELQLDEFTVNNLRERLNALNDKKRSADIAHIQDTDCFREIYRRIRALHSDQQDALKTDNVKFNGKTYIEVLEHIDNTSKVDELIDNSCVFVATSDGIRVRTFIKKRSRHRHLKVTEVDAAYIMGPSRFKRIFVLLPDATGKNIRASMQAMQWSDDLKYPETGEHIIVPHQGQSHEALIDALKEYMGSDEVVVFTVDELADLRAAKKASVPASKARQYVKRPTAPNAYLHTWDVADQRFKRQTMYMTAAELDAYHGPILGMYGPDSVTALSSNFGFVRGMQEYEIQRCAKRIGVNSFLQVRPVTYKRFIGNDKVTCLIKQIEEDFVNKVKVWPTEKYASMSTSGRFQTNVNNAKLRELSHFFGPGRTDEFDNFHTIASIVSKSQRSNQSVEFAEARNLYDANVTAANELFAKRQMQFKLSHPVLYYFLDNEWGLSDVQIADVIRLSKI